MANLYGIFKSVFDRIASFLALFLLFPLFILLAILVRCNLGMPIMFSQLRPGYKSNPFRLIKFRTMTNQRDAAGMLLPDKQRITPFGRWMRSTSMDELPELFNILRGEMSFIGPRPLMMEYLPLYSREQVRRHNVKPGLSGWAQVNGRNAITWEHKFVLDVWYVDNQSFWLDLRIFWLTIWKTIRREGISADGEATIMAFTGSIVNE